MFNAHLISSAAKVRDFPPDRGREVAVVGRSNSGKSSAINRIVGARKLARVSKTPGRTQLINFFELAPGRRFVDLPGYGFARVPEAIRTRWRALVDAYFGSRRSLRGVLIVLDVRRGLTDLDRTMIGWADRIEIPALLLLTKADKLSRGAALRQQSAIAAELGQETDSVLFSALSGQGADAARDRLRRWLELRRES